MRCLVLDATSGLGFRHRQTVRSASQPLAAAEASRYSSLSHCRVSHRSKAKLSFTKLSPHGTPQRSGGKQSPQFSLGNLFFPNPTACICSLLVKRGAWISIDMKDNNGDTPRSLGEGVEDEAFTAALKAASDAAVAKKAQEERMAAGKVYYDATRLLAEGKIAEAIASFESGMECVAARPVQLCFNRRERTSFLRAGWIPSTRRWRRTLRRHERYKHRWATRPPRRRLQALKRSTN